MLMSYKFTFMATLTQVKEERMLLSVFMVEAGNELTADDSAYTHRSGEEPLDVSLERFKSYIGSVRATVFADALRDYLWIREPGETIVEFAKKLMQCKAVGIKMMLPTDGVPKDFDSSLN